MSQENMEIVRRIYQALPNLEAVRDPFCPDYEMDLTDIAPDIGVVRAFDQNLEALRPTSRTSTSMSKSKR
jgi:hypothetical protein